MNTKDREAERAAIVAAGLNAMEREWITGWQGVAGAAFNVVATDLLHKGLLIGPSNWNLNAFGKQVRNHLRGEQ